MKRIAISLLAIGSLMSVSTAFAAKDMACLQTAVQTRENTIITTWSTFSSALSAAHTSRSSALFTAYGSSDAATQRTAIKKIWSDFKTADKNARTALKASRKDAWMTFKADVKKCKGSAKDESAGESMDMTNE